MITQRNLAKVNTKKASINTWVSAQPVHCDARRALTPWSQPHPHTQNPETGVYTQSLRQRLAGWFTCAVRRASCRTLQKTQQVQLSYSCRGSPAWFCSKLGDYLLLAFFQTSEVCAGVGLKFPLQASSVAPGVPFLVLIILSCLESRQNVATTVMTSPLAREALACYCTAADLNIHDQ